MLGERKTARHFGGINYRDGKDFMLKNNMEVFFMQVKMNLMRSRRLALTENIDKQLLLT